jgi:hypothetical protein
VSPSEIAFLAFGLVLGAAIGAALVQASGSRLAPRREVRLTIMPNAIPARRAHTLAVPYDTPHPGIIAGSPDAGGFAAAGANGQDSWSAPVPTEPGDGSITRTRVPSPLVTVPATAVAVPVVMAAADPGRDGWPVMAALRPAVLARSRLERPGRDDPFTTVVPPRPPVEVGRPTLVAGAVTTTTPRATAEPPASRDQPDAAADPSAILEQSAPAAGPCAGQRRMLDERCALADVARDHARSAADTLHEAQRTYDILRDRVDKAESTADPRRIAAEKDRLHAEFRAASDRSGGPDDTENAARTWLTRINELNGAVREANRILEAGRADLRAQLPALERLSAAADAARISSENADDGCHEARELLAACEEAEARAREVPPPPAEEPHPFDSVWPGEPAGLPDPSAEHSPGDLVTGASVIVRILHGDRDARDRLVATLAAGDAEAERDWGLRVSRLVNAIAGRAIEAGYLDVAEDHAFWRLFEPREARDIVGALSALGFRYDGMGGFADGRVPAARDLSLAVGYAGLDRMRIRTWPRESELAGLYEGVVVAADEWLADQADDLSLGRMVDALGGRAAELADLWNAWGRVRPALLAP